MEDYVKNLMVELAKVGVMPTGDPNVVECALRTAGENLRAMVYGDSQSAWQEWESPAYVSEWFQHQPPDNAPVTAGAQGMIAVICALCATGHFLIQR